MTDLSARNFGLLIAYVLPGFVVLWGLSFVSPTVSAWLSGAGAAGPSVGGFLYVFLGSVWCGMMASLIRWAVVDTVHHRTGIQARYLKFSSIQEKLDGFDRIVADHYHYYKFYGNTLVALVGAYPLWRVYGGAGDIRSDLAFLAIEGLLFMGSREALQIFYRRAVDLLGESETSHDERIWRKAPHTDEAPAEVGNDIT